MLPDPTLAGGAYAGLSIPFEQRKDFLRRRVAWAAGDGRGKDELGEFCRALARAEPRFFDENIPFVGYVQFMIEAGGIDGTVFIHSMDLKAESFGEQESRPNAPQNRRPGQGERWSFPQVGSDFGLSTRPALVPSVLDPDDVDHLVAALGVADTASRWGAVDGLRSKGRRALPRLATALKGDNEDVRWMAAMTLYLMGSEANGAAAELVSALGDESAAVRYRAAESLARLGADGPVALNSALADSRPMVRAQAALVQARHHMAAGAALRAGLIEALSSGDAGERQEAANDLREQKGVGLPELPAYIRALRTDDVSLRWGIAAVIGKMGEGAVPALLEALANPDATVRGGAASALNHICKLPRDALKPLLKAREGSTGYDRMENTRAIACLGPYAKPAVADLIADLGREYYLDRQEAVAALGRIGPIKRSVFPAVLKGLSDGDALVRATAAEAVGRFPKRRPDALRALTGALKDNDSNVRRSAASALGGLNPPPTEAMPQLIETLSDLDPTVRQAAALALKRVDDPAAKAAVSRTPY